MLLFSVDTPHTEEEINNYITSDQASNSVKALYHAFQKYHQSEMQQLKQASFAWLTNKIKDTEQKLIDLRIHDETIHINRLAEVITFYVINTAILIEQHRLNIENEVAVNLMAESAVSQALNDSLNELTLPTVDLIERGSLPNNDSILSAIEPIKRPSSDHMSSGAPDEPIRRPSSDHISTGPPDEPIKRPSSGQMSSEALLQRLSSNEVQQQLSGEFVIDRFDIGKYNNFLFNIFFYFLLLSVQ